MLINNQSTKFCQITLRIKRFIHKSGSFFCLSEYQVYYGGCRTPDRSSGYGNGSALTTRSDRREITRP